VITRRDLIKALRDQRRISDWVVIERAQDVATHDGEVRRRELRTRFTIVVHHDGTRGRGSARLDITASAGSSNAIVEQALGLAMAAIGAPWQSAPPSAPAKVSVLDPGLVDLDVRAGELLAEATSAGAKASATIAARVAVLREQVWVHAANGFRDDWFASAQRVDATVTSGGRSFEITREERTRDRLGIADAIATAARDLGELARATAALPGTYDVILGTEALLHGGGYGIWRVFADQGDGVVEHRGVTRYRLNTPIAPGAEEVPEPISITSDGALPFAILSSPVGEEGHAIRKFPLVERGTCIGIGLSAREAALRKRDPNGGVRNLLVSTGTWHGKPSGDRTLEVKRLRSLVLDRSGEASLDVALATAGGQAVTGGSLRLDLVTALATARRHSAQIRRGPYVGPASVLIPDVELIV
jgi:predicted Zn-dependent protease